MSQIIEINTRGYCCVCGAEHANYVINPYSYEIYGSTARE